MSDGSGTTSHDRQTQIAKLRNLYRGRFNNKEAECILKHYKWNEVDAFVFIQESEPQAVRELIQQQSEGEIVEVKKDDDMVRTVTQGLDKATRQFSCQICDQCWWSGVSTKKPVSRCKVCRTKYDPVPRDMEWGWAIFKCVCGKEFSGYGQMGVTRSECYGCGEEPYPAAIRPPTRRRPPKSKQKHKCDAPDCPGSGCGHGVGNAGEDADKQCVHPRSREGKSKVIYPSTIHVSTGSTMSSVADREQDLCSAMYATSLHDIKENKK